MRLTSLTQDAELWSKARSEALQDQTFHHALINMSKVRRDPGDIMFVLFLDLGGKIDVRNVLTKRNAGQDCSPHGKSFSMDVAVEMMFCYAQLGIDLQLQWSLLQCLNGTC